MKTTLVAFLICTLFSFSVKAQGTWSGWVTVFSDNAYPEPHVVQVSFRMAAICNGYSFYRTNTNFNIQNAKVSFNYDYLDCDGQNQTERLTVLLDTAGISFSPTGSWFIGSKVITQFRDVVPYFPKALNNNSLAINNSAGQSNAGSTESSNRDRADLLKADLDFVLSTFNKTYLAAYNKLPSIGNIQGEKDYAGKLDSCKAQFNTYFQQAASDYKNGNGDNLSTKLTSLKDILSRMQYYLNMEGDMRLVYGIANKADTSSSNKNINGQNTQQQLTQFHINQATSNNNDGITQAAQLGVANMNIAYQQAHGNNSAAILQQKLQADQIASLQKRQNSQNTSNLIISTLTLLNNLNVNSNADAKLQAGVAKMQEQTRTMWQDYKNNFGEIEGKIKTEIANDPGNKEVYFRAGLIYMRIGDRYGDLVQKGDLDSLPCATRKDVRILINRLNDFKRRDIKDIQYHNYYLAANYFQRAINIDPNYFIAIEDWGYVSIIPTMVSYKFYEKGIMMNKEWRDRRASEEQDLEKERQYLQKAVDLEPQNKIAINNLIGYYNIIGNDEKAKELKKRIAGN